jgi:hypothetical protein
MYSINALISGNFSWEEYGKHKLISVITTALTTGIACCLSRGSSVSRYANNLVMEGSETVTKEGVKKTSTLSGYQLAKKNLDTKILLRNELSKRIKSKAIKSVAFGLASAGVDHIVKVQLSSFIEHLACGIRHATSTALEEHEVIQTLRKMHHEYGDKQAKKMVRELTKHQFAKSDALMQLTAKCRQGVDVLLEGLNKAHNISKGNVLLESCATFSKYLMIAHNLFDLYKIITAVTTFYDNMNDALRLKLERETSKQHSSIDQEACERFIIKSKDAWRKQIDQNVASYIGSILSTQLNKISKNLLRSAGNNIKSFFDEKKFKVSYGLFILTFMRYLEITQLHNWDVSRILNMKLARCAE